MRRHDEEQAIAADLNLCDIIEMFGDRKAKAKARKHRKACMARINEWNEANGLNDGKTDDELLAELFA